MGVVVAAHHIQLDEKVALKFLLPEALGDTEAVARFAREARAAVKIKSEHVARVTDVGTLENGAPYMVMEYLEGGDLAAWLEQRGALPIEQAVEFVLQACVAMAEAHALGIVHRDLKPANLFCIRRSDGQLSIKVLDFGISKLTDASGLAPGSMTRTSALMGSPLYMSPEQMRSSKDVDAQTDIWALGIILFELLTGRPPFRADSVTELAITVASEPAPAIRSFRPDVPSELEAVIFRCLEKDRRRRYRNVAELALALLPFAPKRARGSVERISGIIQAAGLSTSALATPLPPRTVGAQVSGGTLPAVGRTTLGLTRRKAAVIGAGAAGAIALVAILGLAISWKRASTYGEHLIPVAIQPSAPALSLSATAPDAPKPSGDRLVQAVPLDTLPSGDRLVQAVPVDTLPTVVPTAAASVAAPQASATTKKKLPMDGPAPAVPPVLHDPATTPIPAPKCNPPFYFDSKGARIFKKECL